MQNCKQLILQPLLCLVLLVAAGHGATLADLQETALASRQVIDQQQRLIAGSAEGIRAARSAYYPSVDLSYGTTHLGRDSLYENSDSSVASAAVVWNLFNGFKDTYTIESATFAKEAEDLKLAVVKQDVKLNVALRYLAIFTSKSALQVAADTHDTIEKLYEDAKNRFEVGIIKKNDLLRFKVDLDNAVIDLKKAEMEVQKGLQLLQREVAATVREAELTFPEFAAVPPMPDHGQYRTDMLDRRSELSILTALIDASKAQARAEEAGRYPTLNLQSGYSKFYDNLLSRSSIASDEFRTQLLLSVNLFDGHSRDASAMAATLTAQSLSHERAELELDLENELQLLFMDYQVNAENAAVALLGIDQAQENVRINRLSYREGVTAESDLLDAISNLSRARFSYVEAKSSVFDKYFRIKRAVEGL